MTMSQVKGRKAHFNEADFCNNPPKCQCFIFLKLCFHMQLSFHDLCNVFCFVKIEMQNPKTKPANECKLFIKNKRCSTCMNTPIIEFCLFCSV